MPRTRRSVPPYIFPAPKLNPPLEVSSASFSTGSLDFDHALFAPLHYEPGYAYPLIVWLHGRGGDERQLRRVMPQVSMRNYLAVAPRGLLLSAAEQAQPGSFGWDQEADHIQQAGQRVFDSIELARRKFHINPQRIFLAGFDTGGTMALRLAMSHPERLAGVLSLCGAFPTGGTPFGNLIAARRLGVYLATGRGSEQYTAAQVCEDLRLMHTAGLSVTLREYPCGHELPLQMLSDIDRWIQEQISESYASAVDADVESSREVD